MNAIGEHDRDDTPRGRRVRRFELLLASLVLLVVAYPYAPGLLPWARPNLLLRLLVLLAALHAVTGQRGIRRVGGALCAVVIGSALWGTSQTAPGWLPLVGLGSAHR